MISVGRRLCSTRDICTAPASAHRHLGGYLLGFLMDEAIRPSGTVQEVPAAEGLFALAMGNESGHDLAAGSMSRGRMVAFLLIVMPAVVVVVPLAWFFQLQGPA